MIEDSHDLVQEHLCLLFQSIAAAHVNDIK